MTFKITEYRLIFGLFVIIASGNLLIVFSLYNLLLLPEHSLTVFAGLGMLLAIASLYWLIQHHRNILCYAHFLEQVRNKRDYKKRWQSPHYSLLKALESSTNTLLEKVDVETEQSKINARKLIDAQLDIGRLARYDSVTKLPNRQYFMETLQRAIANAKRKQDDVSIMFFDIEEFKAVNDLYGHKVGDALLAQMAERAKKELRQGDLIASMGADEFIILFNTQPDPVTLSEIASRLASSVAKAYTIEQWQIQVNINIGIASAKSAAYELAELIANADIAMYENKISKNSQYTLFAPQMKETKRRRLAIANNIDGGLSQQEFYLVYQAKVNQRHETVGYEALLRWESSALGPIGPNEFISVAEQSAKIFHLTSFVIATVIKDMQRLISITDNDLKVSLNLSADDLTNPRLVGLVSDLLEQYQLDGRHLEFEVTESAYLNNFDSANSIFSQLKALGCSIALDDFGTGYSSLSYLTKFDLDTLKIDKQFIDDIISSNKSRVITLTIIEMAKHLGLSVCAEGVEKEDQVKLLFDHGCTQIQGYYFSQPKKLSAILSEAHCSHPADD